MLPWIAHCKSSWVKGGGNGKVYCLEARVIAVSQSHTETQPHPWLQRQSSFFWKWPMGRSLSHAYARPIKLELSIQHQASNFPDITSPETGLPFWTWYHLFPFFRHLVPRLISAPLWSLAATSPQPLRVPQECLAGHFAEGPSGQESLPSLFVLNPCPSWCWGPGSWLPPL